MDLQAKAFTVAETAKVMKLSMQTVRKLIHENKLRCVRVGSRPKFLIPETAIDEFLKQETA